MEFSITKRAREHICLKKQCAIMAYEKTGEIVDVAYERGIGGYSLGRGELGKYDSTLCCVYSPEEYAENFLGLQDKEDIEAERDKILDWINTNKFDSSVSGIKVVSIDDLKKFITDIYKAKLE